MIDQSNSALARADTYVREALLALDQGDYIMAGAKLGGALGALEYAGNSQTRLIEAANRAANWLAEDDSGVANGISEALSDAIAHAEGPGID